MRNQHNRQPAHRPCRKTAWLCLELTLLALVVLAVGYRFWRQQRLALWEERKMELVGFTRKAEPLIAALEAYRKEHKEYPDKLEQLVPRYLLHIPKPMNVAQSGWIYGTGCPECADYPYVLFVHVRRHFCPFHFLCLCHLQSPSDKFAYNPHGIYYHNAFDNNEGRFEEIGKWAYYHE